VGRSVRERLVAFWGQRPSGYAGHTEAEARAAGADFVGLEEFITKIEGGWVDVDVIVATPSVMPKIGKLGKVLGHAT